MKIILARFTITWMCFLSRKHSVYYKHEYFCICLRVTTIVYVTLCTLLFYNPNITCWVIFHTFMLNISCFWYIRLTGCRFHMVFLYFIICMFTTNMICKREIQHSRNVSFFAKGYLFHLNERCLVATKKDPTSWFVGYW